MFFFSPLREIMLGGCFLCVALNDVVVLLYLQRMGFLLFWVRFFFFFFAFFPPQFFAEKGKDRIKKNKNGAVVFQLWWLRSLAGP